MAEAQKGIQATLFDYFQDTEYFTLQEAEEHVLDHQKRDVNVPSVRARIYEGIEKGLFERVGKGLYTVTRTDEQGRENKCLLINGDGRDLSFIPSNSVDALITDHPYRLTASLKGGNRNFADYDLFQYTEQDFNEKLRVLKPGHFLVEFLPEENGDNYEYLYRVKDLARKAGFEYYAKVPWKKGDFVANTGRKSKNTEDICFFSKGRARDLRPDAKKDKAEPGVEHFMSGTAGMLPTVFDVVPTSKKDKIHQAEKPVELLRQILRFVTKEDEIALDQFAGSGVLGEAALLEHRDSILIEKDLATYNTLRARIEALDNVKVTTEAQRETLHVAVDALEAVDDGPEATAALAAFHEQKGTSFVDVYQEIRNLAFAEDTTGEQSEVLQDACQALETVYDAALERSERESQTIGETAGDKDVLEAASDALETADLHGKPLIQEDPPEKKVLECSIRGDRRFCSLFAKITINGKERSIEEWFQDAKRTADGKKAGKGKPFDYIVDPFTGDKLPGAEAQWMYRGLWITYFSKNPDLVKYAEQFDEFTNCFNKYKDPGQEVPRGYGQYNIIRLEESVEEVVGAYVKGDRDRYVGVVKASKWYKNMARKMAHAKKPALDDKIHAAHERQAERVKPAEQMTLFPRGGYNRGI